MIILADICDSFLNFCRLSLQLLFSQLLYSAPPQLFWWAQIGKNSGQRCVLWNVIFHKLTNWCNTYINLIQFASYARELNDNAWGNLDAIEGHLATFAVSITSENVDSGAAPNLTIYNMDQRAQDLAEATGIDMILYAPIVEKSEKTGWQQYVSESSQKWIAQDYVG